MITNNSHKNKWQVFRCTYDALSILYIIKGEIMSARGMTMENPNKIYPIVLLQGIDYRWAWFTMIFTRKRFVVKNEIVYSILPRRADEA